jgi:SulP family sulfate permease
LAAVIMVAVVGMIDLKTPVRLFRIKQVDGWCMVATFLATLVLGVSAGIVLGVAVSLALFMWRSSRPRIVELGYLPGKDVFRDVSRFDQATTYPGTAIIRVDSRLYFANAEFVEDRIRELAVERPDLERIIVACSGVNDADAVAVETFETLMTLCRAQGIEFVFAEMKGPVRDLLARAGWHERYGTKTGYVSLKRALRDMGLMPPRRARDKGDGKGST